MGGLLGAIGKGGPRGRYRGGGVARSPESAAAGRGGVGIGVTDDGGLDGLVGVELALLGGGLLSLRLGGRGVGVAHRSLLSGSVGLSSVRDRSHRGADWLGERTENLDAPSAGVAKGGAAFEPRLSYRRGKIGL